MSEITNKKKHEDFQGEAHVPAVAAVFGDEGLSDEVNGLLSEVLNKNTTAYDRAIDAAYVNGSIGSSSTHHITDGSHTFWGAFEAADGALPDDTHLDAAFGAFDHLMRDLTTKSGINPAVSMDPASLERLKDALEGTAGISRSWVNDMFTVNALESAGALLSFFGAVYGFRKGDYRFLGSLVGSSSWASLVSANPIIAVIAVITAVMAWRKAGPGARSTFKKQVVKGGTVTAVVTGVSSLVGGPAIIGLGLGLYAGYLAARKLDGKKCDDPVTITIGKGIRKGTRLAAGFALRAALKIVR
ncbi:MAG: hypothetical protein KBA61_06540 [Spirochaetes bacterium]|nr:hypothetical protein [Spirochaetota bacterium]